MDEFNNDETPNVMNKITQGASNIANKFKQTSKNVGKKMFQNPLIWKIALILLGVFAGLLFFILMVSAIISLFQIDTFDKNNSTLSSLYGINGDKFYGARLLYKDDEKASSEIQDDYLKFTYTILTDANISGISLSEDYRNNETVLTVATEFANKLANLPQDETSEIGTENYNFVQSTTIINHFGFKENEITIIIDSIANTIINNTSTSESALQIKAKLTEAILDSKYNQYKQVTDKIFIYDYILDDNKAGIENLQKKNYVGFVFMPKEDVVLKSTSFRFVVDGGYGVNTSLKYKSNTEITDVIEETNVDITWYNDGEYKTLDSSDVNLALSKFDAINQSNITELNNPVSIKTLLNQGKLNSYFNVQEGEINAENLLNNIKSNKYLYLTFSSLKPFNFAEYITEYSA